jgi:Transglutaminase-like superfamily
MKHLLQTPAFRSDSLKNSPTNGHRVFRAAWWSTNALLIVAAAALLYSGAWEYSVREYLRGFSDALIPASSSPEQKVEAILSWMRNGPQRPKASNPEELSKRDPETTLNYQQLLSVCGTATNAFLNLARSSGLSARRLLLLTPERSTKHVVAEVFIGERWIIVDPTYRTLMRDAQGHLLTRKELQNPAVFAQATSSMANYPSVYDYKSFAHVRLARLPLQGLGLRRLLDRIDPGWDEAWDWSLLLERESFFILFVSSLTATFFLILRLLLGWYADHRLRIPRFRLREHALRAGAAFVSTPEIKQ